MWFTCCLAQSAWLWTPLHLRTLWEPQRSAWHLCVFVPLIMLRKKRVLWATLGAGCRLPTPSEDDNSTAIFWANFFIGWAKTKWFFLTPARSWNQPRSIEKEQSGSSMPGRACTGGWWLRQTVRVGKHLNEAVVKQRSGNLGVGSQANGEKVKCGWAAKWHVE